MAIFLNLLIFLEIVVFIFHFLAQPMFFHLNFSLLLLQLSKEIHVFRYWNFDPTGFTSSIVTHDCIWALLGHQPFLHGRYQLPSNTSHSSDQSPTMNQIYVGKAYNRNSEAKGTELSKNKRKPATAKEPIAPFLTCKQLKAREGMQMNP